MPDTPRSSSTLPSQKRPAQTVAVSPEIALARRILSAEAASVQALADRLASASAHTGAATSDQFLQAIELLVRCADSGGNVLVAGLGKSGLIGQKISATLASLAITSHFVHPSEAAHGDLGRFRSNDVCIALSYSGETDEVVALAAILKQDNLPVIAITRGVCEAQPAPSSLERLSTVTLPIGDCDDPEISPAPACSTTASLALGDALAICSAFRRNFTTDDFAKRHPGGALGGLLRPVVEILRFTVGKNLAAMPDHLSVGDAFAQADAASGARRPGALLLVNKDSGKLTGLFTDGDLRRLVIRSTAELSRPISELMTRNPTTLPDTALVRDAVRLVRENRRDEIPVVNAAGQPVGLLDVQDLIAMKLIKDS